MGGPSPERHPMDSASTTGRWAGRYPAANGTSALPLVARFSGGIVAETLYADVPIKLA